MTAAPIPYSPCQKAGDFLFVSGQIGVLDGELVADVEGQIRQGISNLSDVLKNNGASFENVVKTVVFLSDMSHYAAMNDIYGQFFTSDWPARSTVAVKELPRSAHFEIEAVAYVG